MKRGLLLLLAVVCGVACSRPKVIPDDRLALIFRDAFLANAYVSREHVEMDSLNVYEPIFDRYGYTAEDVQYTIGNFSKRKSARLSDVVERAINLLDTESKYFDREVAILDTIDNVSRRELTRTVYRDSLIRVDRLRDTARLRFTLDRIRPGEYRVSLRYEVDSLDRNPTLRAGVWLDRAGRPRTRTYNYTLYRGREESFIRTLKADSADRRLVFDFAGLPDKPQRPSITIRDLKVEYTPPTPVAVDSFYRRQLDVRIFAEEFFRNAFPQDSL